MLALIVASGVLAFADGSDEAKALRLRLSAPAEILVGEPTKFTTTWTSTRPVEVVTAKAQVCLDSGNGFRRHDETSFGTASTVYLPETLMPGEPIATEHVVAVTGYAAGPEERHFALAFPLPGRYLARVQYGGVVSNVATIDVKLPKGKDAELLVHLQRRPELLSQWGLIEGFGDDLLDKLLDEYRGSRYLARSRVLSWRKHLEESRAFDKQAGTKPSEGKTGQLLDGIAAEELEESPFEEDRLLLMAEIATSIGDRRRARTAYESLVSRHPKTTAAAKAKKWMAAEDVAAAREEIVQKP
jgi:hypothetical protein